MSKGRPRQFDTDSALDEAMLVFWRLGYRGTSLDDLTEAMDINRPSLYAAFGDKEKLFLAAIDRYREKHLSDPIKKLLAAENLQKGLAIFFNSMLSVILNEDNPPGCMIACLLSEECCESDVIRAKLADSINSADAVFTLVFKKNKDQLSSGLSPEAAGKLMITTLHGISIRARSGAVKKELQGIAQSFMKLVLR